MRSPSMELRQLKHFLAVIDCTSLGDASRKLDIPQPTLTRSIQSLERSLGARLFSRDNQRMTLNQFGRALETYARTISTASDHAHHNIGELLAARRGLVTVGSGPMFVDAILPIATSRFRQANPGIDVIIIEGTIEPLRAGLMSGDIDCVFLAMPSKLASPMLQHEVLLPRQPVVTVTRSDNPLLLRPNLRAMDVLEETWIVAAPSDFRSAVEQTFYHLNLPVPTPAIESASVTVTKKILGMGHYLAVLPQLILRDEIKANILQTVPIPELSWECDPGVVFRRDTPPMPAAKKFIETVRLLCAEFMEEDRSDFGTSGRAAAAMSRSTRTRRARRAED
jgi:LysR family transcriptional regulator, regulator of abg operon